MPYAATAEEEAVGKVAEELRNRRVQAAIAYEDVRQKGVLCTLEPRRIAPFGLLIACALSANCHSRALSLL